MLRRAGDTVLDSVCLDSWVYHGHEEGGAVAPAGETAISSSLVSLRVRSGADIFLISHCESCECSTVPHEFMCSVQYYSSVGIIGVKLFLYVYRRRRRRSTPADTATPRHVCKIAPLSIVH